MNPSNSKGTHYVIAVCIKFVGTWCAEDGIMHIKLVMWRRLAARLPERGSAPNYLAMDETRICYVLLLSLCALYAYVCAVSTSASQMYCNTYPPRAGTRAAHFSDLSITVYLYRKAAHLTRNA